MKLQLAHSGSSVVTCPFPAYSDPWDIFVATCSLRRCSLSGEILVPTSERLKEGEMEEGSKEGERRKEESKDASVIPVSQISVAP